MTHNIDTKPPTKRAQELAAAMLAGYEDDPRTLLQLLLRRRAATMVDLQQAWERGRKARLLRPSP